MSIGDSLSELLNEKALQLVELDGKSITQLLGVYCNNSIVSLSIIPYIALYCRSAQDFLGEKIMNDEVDEKISDIRNRVKIGNSASADIFVSIHLNKIPQQQYWGWQCFYSSKSEESMKLAKILQSSLNDAIQKDNKRVAMKLDTVYIMKHVEIPISIVECGFLSNPEEEQQLLDDEYQDKLAWGIYNGIIEYFTK